MAGPDLFLALDEIEYRRDGSTATTMKRAVEAGVRLGIALSAGYEYPAGPALLTGEIRSPTEMNIALDSRFSSHSAHSSEYSRSDSSTFVLVVRIIKDGAIVYVSAFHGDLSEQLVRFTLLSAQNILDLVQRHASEGYEELSHFLRDMR